MAYDSNKGVSMLGAVLTDRMKSVSDMGGQGVDFGEIQADYSLKCNTFSQAIPKTDYSVLLYLTIGATLTSTQSDGKHGGHTSGTGSHSHTIKTPTQLSGLAPGDRVVVVWIGNEAVVIGKATKL